MIKNEEMDKAFDPAKFGFETYKVGRACKCEEGDYIRLTNGKSGQRMYIILCEDSYRFVHDLYESDEICLAVNDKGALLIYNNPEERRLRMSKMSGTTCRRIISINGLREKFVEIFGEFTVLPLETSIYANGDAVMLKPRADRITR